MAKNVVFNTDPSKMKGHRTAASNGSSLRQGVMYCSGRVPLNKSMHQIYGSII
ncbi:hypothetical protein RvY_14262 [Ramazzottius varieornatus]|uniref:Uncharacterized protein n=1 Tax=Ramazzottius varieornatus TaxID=947166 RepID=A0A1D1VXZ2_RAMVA|nr:hypothetical protein RvY_14262 [Ramazzottius varieornatus]